MINDWLIWTVDVMLFIKVEPRSYLVSDEYFIDICEILYITATI